MRSLLVKVALVATLALLVASFPALAAQGRLNPSQTCADNTITVVAGPFSFPQEIPSHGGCASTVARYGNPTQIGDYSHSAYVAQCKSLREELPAELWNAPVIIDYSQDPPSNVGGFGGKIQTCTYLLKGYHSGTLTHPE
ncbi:MAG: hypothetical protein H0U55_15640 [Rubrobacteraceae bacterium]|nr:hypothetical protein [Rubrobacteraceae bacterium]